MKLPAIIKTRVVTITVASIIVAAIIWSLCRDIGSSGKIRNVLLISIDTCRADHVGCYGYPLDTTPNIDALAGEGIVFENTISPLPYTLPAHCSMLTGTIPPYHGVLDNGLFTFGEDGITLAEIFKGQGFATGAFISTYILDSEFGLDQGFDVYNDEFEDSRSPMGIHERRGGETTRLAIDWLGKNRDEKQFLFVHYYDPHFPYDAPDPFGSKFASSERLKDLPRDIASVYASYAGEIAYADHCIGEIIDKLKELEQYDSTLICVTADHGEMLGEHDETTHGYFIYRGNIDVPLVFKIPGMKERLTLKSCVGLIDIVPTICSALGIKIKHEVQGKDLMAYYENSEPYPDRHLYCQSLEPTKYNANPLLGVVSGQYKYIHTTNSELYNLDDDKFELKNLIRKQPDKANLMRGKLDDILEDAKAAKQTNSRSGVDAETLRKLESLGYMGSIVDETFLIDPEKADPKELIGYHVLGSEVGFFLQTEEYERAEKICLEMIEQKPDQYMGYYKMAKCLAFQQKYSDAIKYLLKMTEFDKRTDYAYVGLADCYRHLKQFDTSIKYALKALELKSDFVEAYYQLSACYYENGMFDEPEKYLNEEIAGHPRYYKIVVALAEKLYETGQIRHSYNKYSEVLELDPDSFDGLNSLAWFQAASTIEGIRNPQQAVKNAIMACEVCDYKKPESLDTLAVAYAAAGRFLEAKQTAQKAIRLAQSAGDTALAQRISNRLKLFETGKPYLDASLAHDAVR